MIEDLFYLEQCLSEITEEMRQSLNLQTLEFIHQCRVEQSDISAEQLLSYGVKSHDEVDPSDDIYDKPPGIQAVAAPTP